MMNLIFALLSTTPTFAANSSFAQMKAQTEKAVSCRTNTASADSKALIKSVTCYQGVFSDKLSDKEQAGMSYWFNNLKAVKKIWACDGKEYQLKTYHSYTPNFVCVQLTDEQGKDGTRLIFFDKTKKGLGISSVYTPIKW